MRNSLAWMRARSRERDTDGGVPHLLLMGLSVFALVVLAVIGFSAKFQAFNSQGLLTGPFSALLLLAAAMLALLLLVLADWKIWNPRRQQKASAAARWLAMDVLGAKSSPDLSWRTLGGQFGGYEIVLTRVAATRLGAVRWSLLIPGAENYPVFSVLRSNQQNVADPSADKYASGDSEFDRKYLWQSAQPEKVQAILKNDCARQALKRLASLFAQRGSAFASDFGMKIGGGAITLLQSPVPWLRPGTFSAGEVLLILHDLTELADVLTGRERPVIEQLPLTEIKAGATPWLALGCAILLGLALWLGLTGLAARWGGMSAAMIVFFIPPLMLAFIFMLISAGGTGRDAEIDDAIRSEAAKVIAERPELAKLLNAFEK